MEGRYAAKKMKCLFRLSQKRNINYQFPCDTLSHMGGLPGYIQASHDGTTKKCNENRIEFDLQIKCFDSPERIECPRLHVHQNKLAEF